MSERATVLFEDALELDFNGQECGMSPESLSGYVQLLADLCHVQSARAAGEVIEVFGRVLDLSAADGRPAWDHRLFERRRSPAVDLRGRGG